MNEKEKSGAITQEEWDNIVLQKNIEKENFTNEEISQIDSFLTFNEKFFTKILKVSKEDYRKLDNVFGGKMTDIKRIFIRGFLVWIGLFTFNFREYLNNITNKKEVKK